MGIELSVDIDDVTEAAPGADYLLPATVSNNVNRNVYVLLSISNPVISSESS